MRPLRRAPDNAPSRIRCVQPESVGQDQMAGEFGTWVAFYIVAAIAGLVGARMLASRLELRGGSSYRLRTLGLAALVTLPVLGWFVAGGAALTFDLPVRERFNIVGGLALSPEFSALLIGLVVYTAAFIGEVVRGGIQAVGRRKPGA